MAENTVERKLRAILCADVKGYSRMMGDDEVGTYQTLTANIETIRSIISEHKGRGFSSPRDTAMAEETTEHEPRSILSANLFGSKEVL